VSCLEQVKRVKAAAIKFIVSNQKSSYHSTVVKRCDRLRKQKTADVEQVFELLVYLLNYPRIPLSKVSSAIKFACNAGKPRSQEIRISNISWLSTTLDTQLKLIYAQI